MDRMVSSQVFFGSGGNWMMLGCVALAAAGIKKSRAVLHYQLNLTQQNNHTSLLLNPARLQQVCMLIAQD
jgi:hypothetical protein